MAMIQEAASNSLSPWKLNNDENYKQDVKLKRRLSLVDISVLKETKLSGEFWRCNTVSESSGCYVSPVFQTKKVSEKKCHEYFEQQLKVRFSLHYVKSDTKCTTHHNPISNDNGQRLARSNEVTDNYKTRKMGQKWLWFILTCRTCWK